MFDLNEVITLLNETLNLSLTLHKQLVKKNTARSLQKYVLSDAKSKAKYILEVALSDVERFYLQRVVEYQKRVTSMGVNFKFNAPLYTQSGNKISYSLSHYFDAISFTTTDIPLQKIEAFYKSNSKKIEVNDENIQQIVDSFLQAWPHKFHAMIRRQKEYKEYKQELREFKSLEVAFEHGDFTTNNIVKYKGDLYLFDFEFSREFQPLGFDAYDYACSLKKSGDFKDDAYVTLHEKKYALIEKINDRVDRGDISVEIYNDFDDATLQKEWKKLYNKGANYNLSYEWSKTWYKHFKKSSFKLFIFTLWRESELLLLAPLYEKNSILRLIGSNPDLYDSFSLLYKDEKSIKGFYEYIFKHNYKIDFKYLQSDSSVAKILIKYLYQKNIAYESKIIDTKPRVNFESFKLKTKEKSDIKRCKNRALKDYKKELTFQFVMKKDDALLQRFILMHKERWGGGPFENIKNYEAFIKEITRSDLVLISALLMQDEVVAYHFAYKDSKGILNSGVPVFSAKHNKLSPGKVLLSEILNHTQQEGSHFFDFGRGAEEYKYWFANESSLLFHIKTLNTQTLFYKGKKIIERVFNKLDRMINE